MTKEEKKEIAEFHIERIKRLEERQEKNFDKLVKELNIKERVDEWTELCYNDFGDLDKEIDLL